MRIIYYDGKETRKTGFVDNINALKLVFPVSNSIPDDHLHLCAIHGAIYYHETKIDGKEHFGTYGKYHTWHFEDWNDVWETYTDGYGFNSWYKNLLSHDTNGLKSSLVRHGFDINNEAFIEDLYEAIQEKDWRHSSCGGCI